MVMIDGNEEILEFIIHRKIGIDPNGQPLLVVFGGCRHVDSFPTYTWCEHTRGGTWMVMIDGNEEIVYRPHPFFRVCVSGKLLTVCGRCGGLLHSVHGFCNS